MNHLAFMIYIYGILPSVNLFFLLFAPIFPFIAIIFIVVPLSEGDITTKFAKKCVFFSLPIWILGLIFAIFLPNQKTFAEMMLIPKIVTNNHVQSIVTKSDKVAELYLNKFIKQMKDNK